jgi:RNA polymerase sigma-70 factor (ECF subfamily)
MDLAARDEAAGDRDLVRRVQQGDLHAFDELAHRHAPRAYGVALGILRNHHDAEDVAQDALLAAWQGHEGFRHDCEFGTWLHTIVTRLALNKSRRRRPVTGWDLTDCAAAADTEPAQAVERAAMTLSLHTALLALPDPQRSAVMLHHLDGQSYAQIARGGRTTVPAVRSHLFRGRRALAAAIDSWR